MFHRLDQICYLAAVAVWRKAVLATNGRRFLHWLVQSTVFAGTFLNSFCVISFLLVFRISLVILFFFHHYKKSTRPQTSKKKSQKVRFLSQLLAMYYAPMSSYPLPVVFLPIRSWRAHFFPPHPLPFHHPRTRAWRQGRRHPSHRCHPPRCRKLPK